MRSALFFLSLVLLATAASAQSRSDWSRVEGGGCIGGRQCPEKRLTLPLRDLPVIGVRFRAHDEMGETAGGKLRVRIDRNSIRDGIDIPRKGETFTIEVDELRGRTLVFEPAADDEVVIDQIAVLYAPERTLNRERDRDRGRDRSPSPGWTSYRNAGMCIGGDECRKNGNRIMIALENAPVLGIRFYAHDNFGTRADGRLSVRIDETPVESYIDVKREGRRHDFEVDNVRGAKLVISAANDDEVEVSDIEVLYGRGGGGRGGSGGQREITDEGACIGGTECGGRRSRIRINLRGRNVVSVRFYARDDVGARANGELRIRVDDEVIQDYLDIPREGKTFTIDGRGLAGDFLIIEPAEDDEVVVRDVRVKVEEW